MSLPPAPVKVSLPAPPIKMSFVAPPISGTLRGWAKLDTAAGESAIQSNVTWSIANYTDATARQYLIDTYHSMSWLKALASQNIHTIVVTLLTSQ
jgi:hypothetical protein